MPDITDSNVYITCTSDDPTNDAAGLSSSIGTLSLSCHGAIGNSAIDDTATSTPSTLAFDTHDEERPRTDTDSDQYSNQDASRHLDNAPPRSSDNSAGEPYDACTDSTDSISRVSSDVGFGATYSDNNTWTTIGRRDDSSTKLTFSHSGTISATYLFGTTATLTSLLVQLPAESSNISASLTRGTHDGPAVVSSHSTTDRRLDTLLSPDDQDSLSDAVTSTSDNRPDDAHIDADRRATDNTVAFSTQYHSSVSVDDTSDTGPTTNGGAAPDHVTRADITADS
ncbi:hypothetical protein PINS_up003358 [Pythium insidiosum]|nr:hypothetical protein PINS_up003358 [Pythium insidiosum]